MAPCTLRSALNYYLKQPGLTEDDREHIKRWFVEADDPVWEKIAADTRAHGEVAAVVEGPYSIFIGSALRARCNAKSLADTSPSLLSKQEHQREQQRRIDLLELADRIDEVVRRYPLWRSPQAPPPPGSANPDWLEEQRSLKWLEQQAQKLRQRAATDQKAHPGWDYVRVNVSRQSGGVKKHPQSRELGVFIRTIVNCMHRACGKPCYHAVATMTNIAFPDAYLGAEDVRSLCRPTTRSGRRQSTGALR
jgi:hypothetical protein